MFGSHGWLSLLAGLTIALSAPPHVAGQPTDQHGDPLPPGAVARMGTTRLRHGDTVLCVAWSPDGKLVAGSGPDKLVRFWDPVTGKEIARLPAHSGTFWHLAFSHDGKWLATSSRPPTIDLWEIARIKEPDLKPRPLTAWPESVSAVVFARDNKTLHSCTSTNTLRTWDLTTDKESRQFGHQFQSKQTISHIALSRDGSKLVSAHIRYERNEASGAIHLWNPATGEYIRQVGTMPGYVYQVAFSPDGETIAAAGHQGVKLWDSTTGTESVKLLDQPTPSYTPCLAFAPDGRSLYAGGSGFFREWALPSGRAERSFTLGADSVLSIAVSPDGKTLATGTSRAVVFWDVATGKPRHHFLGHQGTVDAVVFAAADRELLTGGSGRTLFRWDLTGKRLGEWVGPAHHNGRLVLSPDGKILAAEGANLAVVLSDPVTGKERLRFTNHLPPYTSASTPIRFVFTPDSRLVFSATQGVDEYLRVWESQTGKEIYKVYLGKGDQVAATGLAVSPDGRLLYVASRLEPIRVLDTATGKELRRIGNGGLGAVELKLSPDGRRLAAILAHEVCVWDAESGEVVWRWRQTSGGYSVLQLAFSADGRSLAVVSEREPARLWELASGKVRLDITGHVAPARSLAFSADGRLLATGSADTTALVWDMDVLPLVGYPNTLAARNIGTLWHELGSDDARTAFRAVTRLRLLGNRMVEPLAARLKPIEGKSLNRLVVDLDSNVYQVRERAIQELIALGRTAEPALVKALSRNPTLEMRRRIQTIREKMPPETRTEVDRLRPLRAVEAMEGIGTPEARRLLETVASGIPEVELTVEAQAALERMAKRSGGTP